MAFRPAGRVNAEFQMAVAVAAIAGVLWALFLATSAGAQERSEPPVTAAVQVTKTVDPARGHTEPQMLVHPDDPNILVIVEAEFLSSTCHVHVSRDRGRTWTDTGSQPLPSGYQACSRPTFGPSLAAAFGVDGTLYVVNAASDSAGGRGPTDAYVARSTDLGETWEFAFVRRSTEREFVLADGTMTTAAERYAYVRMAVHPTDPNRVYAGFRVQDADTTAPPRSFVSVSTDRGATWSEPVDVMDQTFGRDEVQGSDVPALAVAPDGTIYAFTKERPPMAPSPAVPPSPAPSPSPQPTPGASPAPGASPQATPPAAPSPEEAELPPGPGNLCQPLSAAEPLGPEASPSPSPSPTSPPPSPPGPGEPGAGARLLMAKSTDGGATWTGSVVDDSGVVCVPCLTTPEAALDPRTGAVYVVFEQSDSPPPNARDDRNVWFMRSTDGGETWSERLQLNDDDGPDPGYDQMFPGISLASTGRIDVAWQDFRTDALYNPDGSGETDRSNQTCWDIFYTFSTDGGATWAPNVRVSDRSMNQFEGYAMNLAYDLRGPTGVASTDAEAHVAWSDSRAGRFELPAEDVYFASVLHDDQSPPDQVGVHGASLALGGAAGLLVAGLALLLSSVLLRARRISGAGSDVPS